MRQGYGVKVNHAEIGLCMTRATVVGWEQSACFELLSERLMH